MHAIKQSCGLFLVKSIGGGFAEHFRGYSDFTLKDLSKIAGALKSA